MLRHAAGFLLAFLPALFSAFGRGLLFEPDFHPDGGEGNEGGNEDPEGWLQFPSLGELGIEQGGTEKAEKDAVNHADNADSQGFAPDVFQRHGNTKQDEIGEGFDNTDDSETADGRTEHAQVIGRDDLNNKKLVFGFW